MLAAQISDFAHLRTTDTELDLQGVDLHYRCRFQCPEMQEESIGITEEFSPGSHFQVSNLRQEKGAQIQTFGSGYLPMGWGSST